MDELVFFYRFRKAKRKRTFWGNYMVEINFILS
jgi:hypothetical protein